ncbi:MAG: rRNA (cytidine-2'-O-)-methyltransferase, partial [Pseudomonadota bacterium]
ADMWTFAGFMPTKQGARIARLESLASVNSTLVFFESPNRLSKCLADMITVFGNERHACVARELTKLHEEIVTMPLAELGVKFSDREVKGEIVVLVSPPDTQKTLDAEALLQELLQSMSVSKAATEAAQLTGQSKRELYQKALALKESFDE